MKRRHWLWQNPLHSLPYLKLLKCYLLLHALKVLPHSNGCAKWILIWIYHKESLCWTTSAFENSDFLNHVYKLNKALYGLKEFPSVWHERLSRLILGNNFSIGKLIATLQKFMKIICWLYNQYWWYHFWIN